MAGYVLGEPVLKCYHIFKETASHCFTNPFYNLPPDQLPDHRSILCRTKIKTNICSSLITLILIDTQIMV